MRRTLPSLRPTHDLVDVVERVLEGGVLVEEVGDGRGRRPAIRAEPPWFSIPLGHIDVISIHDRHPTPVAGGPPRSSSGRR